MKQDIIISMDKVDNLLINLHDDCLHKEELIIECIAKHGYTFDHLKQLTKQKAIKMGLMKNCDYLKSFENKDLLFPYTVQYINRLLKRVQDKYFQDDHFENFNTHFFRKAYGKELFNIYQLKGDDILEALKKVSANLNHFRLIDTVNYLNLNINLKKDQEKEVKPSKGLNILKGPTDEETAAAAKEKGI